MAGTLEKASSTPDRDIVCVTIIFSHLRNLDRQMIGKAFWTECPLIYGAHGRADDNPDWISAIQASCGHGRCQGTRNTEFDWHIALNFPYQA